MQRVGHVAGLWRFPVKSMGGEPCRSLALDGSGVAGDRRLAFESTDAPPGKPLLGSVQRAAMLRFRASTEPDGAVTVLTPEGRRLKPGSPELLAQLHATLPSPAALTLLHDPHHPFTDVRPIALHTCTAEHTLAAALGAPFDPRRLRSNLVLDLDNFAPGQPFPEDLLAGRTVRLGETAELQITESIPRCRMVSLQPETTLADRSILRWLALHHAGRAGVYARCTTPGTVHLGDPVLLLGA